MEWIPIIEAEQILVEAPDQHTEMEVDVANLQEDLVEIAEAVGEVEAAMDVVAEGRDQVIQGVEMDAANLDMEIAQAAIGAVEAAKVVAAGATVIPMIKIPEEDNQDAMTIIAQAEAAAVKAVEIPGEEVVQVLLQANAADAAIGDLFSKTTIKQ